MTKFTQTYPTDLKYTEWQLIVDYFPKHRLGRPQEMGNVANSQCNLVCSAHRLPMANASNQPATVANCLWLFSTVEEKWFMGTDQ